ncbi:MAG: hypothetical protein HY658_06220 [Actinobacteria bacterium]|nr:hypothetical protein [Actinomycetota bacterium]
MRRWTLVTLVVLFVVLVGAAIWQLVLLDRYEPASGPPATVTPTSPAP